MARNMPVDSIITTIMTRHIDMQATTEVAGFVWTGFRAG
jgi:hypothetical protein